MDTWRLVKAELLGPPYRDITDDINRQRLTRGKDTVRYKRGLSNAFWGRALLDKSTRRDRLIMRLRSAKGEISVDAVLYCRRDAIFLDNMNIVPIGGAPRSEYDVDNAGSQGHRAIMALAKLLGGLFSGMNFRELSLVNVKRVTGARRGELKPGDINPTSRVAPYNLHFSITDPNRPRLIRRHQ